MSHDIREVLQRQAAAVEDTRHGDRIGEVRDRIRTVRRRRASLVSAAAVVLVGAVVLGSSLLPGRNGDGATPASLAGHRVPVFTTSLGYEFRYADSAVGDDGTLSVGLPRSSEPRLVRWASADDRGRLVLDPGTGAEPWTGPAGDFDGFALIPAGNRSKVTLSQRGTTKPGKVALAVYDLTRPAPGLTVDGITFRDEVQGGRLLGAGIGRPGAGSVRFPVRATRGQLNLRVFCAGGAQQRLAIEVDGDPQGEVGCGNPASYDPASTSSSLGLRARKAGSQVLLRLLDADGTAATAKPGDRLGGGVYSLLAHPGQPLVVEEGGHHWQRTAVHRTPRGQPTATFQVAGDGRTLVRWELPGTSGVGTLRVADGDQSSFSGDGTGFGSSELSTGGRTVRVSYTAKPKGSIVVASYRLLD